MDDKTTWKNLRLIIGILILVTICLVVASTFIGQ